MGTDGDGGELNRIRCRLLDEREVGAERVRTEFGGVRPTRCGRRPKAELLNVGRVAEGSEIVSRRRPVYEP